MIVLGVSIVLYSCVLLEMLPQIEIIDKTKDNSTSNVFHDLHNDKVKEGLAFDRDGSDKSIYFLTLFKEDKHYIAQYNFKPTTMRLDWIAYSDLNSDNKKEIIAFYEKQDTIYIDWANDKYMMENIFVLAKPDTIYADVWNPLLRVCIVLK